MIEPEEQAARAARTSARQASAAAAAAREKDVLDKVIYTHAGFPQAWCAALAEVLDRGHLLPRPPLLQNVAWLRKLE